MTQPTAQSSAPYKHPSLLATLWHDLQNLGKRKYKSDELVCWCMHRSFYLWFLILFGWFTGALLHHFEHIAKDTTHTVTLWTWMYIAVLFYTLIMLLFDISSVKLILSLGTFLLLWVSASYLEAMHPNIAIVGPVVKYFRNLNPTVNSGFPVVLSWLLFVPWLLMFLESYRSGRKTFSPNGIEERNLGVGVEITNTAGLHFACKYPDLLETVLGLGAGTILAFDQNERVIKEWNNVTLLYFKWPRIDEILHKKSVIVDNAADEPVDVVIDRRPPAQ